MARTTWHLPVVAALVLSTGFVGVSQAVSAEGASVVFVDQASQSVTFTGAAGVVDNIVIRGGSVSDGAGIVGIRYYVTGRDGIVPGAGCNRRDDEDPRRLVCLLLPDSEDPHPVLRVRLGDRDDVADVRIMLGTGRVEGGSGNDTLRARGGDLHLYGGDGADLVRGGVGHGGAGADLISGGGVSYGDAGNDTLTGGAKADVLYGGTGADLIRGAEGNDVLYGNSGADILYGNSGNDRLSGGPGNDKVSGGPGRDTVSGGPGDDRVTQ